MALIPQMLVSLKKILNRIRQKVPPLEAIEHKSFLLLKLTMSFILLISILYSGYLLTNWIFDRDDGIIIQPVATIGVSEAFDGTSLADLLRYDLRRIKDIYEPIQDLADGNKTKNSYSKFYIPSVALKEEHLDYSLSTIGTVGALGVSLPLGNIISAIKELSGDQSSVITCSIQKYNSTLIMIATLEDHHSPEKDVMAWEVRKTLDKNNLSIDEEIPLLIDDLAFQISHGTSRKWAKSKNCPRAWQSFKYLTKGRDAYRSYIITKNKTDLDRARDLAALAKRFEPSYNGSSELLSELGLAYLNNKNYDEAANIFENITDIKPFERAVGLGVSYGGQKKFVESLDAFNEATRLNPYSSEAWYNKGFILYKQGRYNEAIQAYDKAIEIDPRWTWPLNNKGLALDLLSKHDEAIQAYDKALEIDPQLAKAWNNKGIALDLLGKHDEAVQAYNKAIEINPLLAEAQYNKGVALCRMGTYYESLQAYNKAIEINPLLAEAQSSKGIALSRMGMYNESLQAYNKAIEINPSLAEAQYNKGVALYQLGKYNESLQAYDKAIEIDPKYFDSWYNKGKVLNCLNRSTESTSAFYTANQLKASIRSKYRGSEFDKSEFPIVT
jgi:tetratricopeptide (TPR) repeat protein